MYLLLLWRFGKLKNLRSEGDIVRFFRPEKGGGFEILTPFFDLLTVEIVDPPHRLDIAYRPKIPLGC